MKHSPDLKSSCGFVDGKYSSPLPHEVAARGGEHHQEEAEVFSDVNLLKPISLLSQVLGAVFNNTSSNTSPVFNNIYSHRLKKYWSLTGKKKTISRKNPHMQQMQTMISYCNVHKACLLSLTTDDSSNLHYSHVSVMLSAQGRSLPHTLPSSPLHSSHS